MPADRRSPTKSITWVCAAPFTRSLRCSYAKKKQQGLGCAKGTKIIEGRSRQCVVKIFAVRMLLPPARFDRNLSVQGSQCCRGYKEGTKAEEEKEGREYSTSGQPADHRPRGERILWVASNCRTHMPKLPHLSSLSGRLLLRHETPTRQTQSKSVTARQKELELAAAVHHQLRICYRPLSPWRCSRCKLMRTKLHRRQARGHQGLV